MRLSLVATASLMALAVGLGGCATTMAPPVPQPSSIAQTAAQRPHDALFHLFKDDDEASLKLNPLNAIYRGDLRYADQFGDYVTDAYYDATRAQAQASLGRLHAIDRNVARQARLAICEISVADGISSRVPMNMRRQREAPTSRRWERWPKCASTPAK